MTELEFQLRASDVDETSKLIQRELAANMKAAKELIATLRAAAEMWRERFEAERADHERSIRHAEKALNEEPTT